MIKAFRPGYRSVSVAKNTRPACAWARLHRHHAARRDGGEKRGIAPGQMPRRGLRAIVPVELLGKVAIFWRESAHRFQECIAFGEIAIAVIELRRRQGREI